MKLSQLAAEAAARLKDLRDKHGQEADAECLLTDDEFHLEAVELFKGVRDGKWYFHLMDRDTKE